MTDEEKKQVRRLAALFQSISGEAGAMCTCSDVQDRRKYNQEAQRLCAKGIKLAESLGGVLSGEEEVTS